MAKSAPTEYGPCQLAWILFGISIGSVSAWELLILPSGSPAIAFAIPAIHLISLFLVMLSRNLIVTTPLWIRALTATCLLAAAIARSVGAIMVAPGTVISAAAYFSLALPLLWALLASQNKPLCRSIV